MKPLTRILAMSTATIIASATIAQGTHAAPARPSWLPTFWYAIGACETGLNWKHHSVGKREYEGAFGFLHSSWAAYRPAGAPLHAYQATPKQQLQGAINLARRVGGYNGWGCYTHGGYRSHL